MSGAIDFDPTKYLARPAEPKVVPLRHIPNDWEEGLTLLSDRIRPEWTSADRWTQVISDAIGLATRYQDMVLDAGWSTENLFGFEPDRIDGFYGLAVAMRGGSLASIDTNDALIQRGNSFVIHKPFLEPGGPLLWNFKDSKRRR